MSQQTENAHGVTPDDEGEDCVVRYWSKYHPDADEKTTVEGVVDEVYEDASKYVFIETDDGRVLEVTPRSVVLLEDAEGTHVDETLGTDPEVEVKRLYRVYVTGTTVKYVRADDENTARDAAITATDHGEMYDNTDKNAATRADEVPPPHDEDEVFDA